MKEMKEPVVFIRAAGPKARVKWEKTPHNYLKIVLGEIFPPQGIKFEMICLNYGVLMYPHFHSQKDEILVPTDGHSTIKIAGMPEKNFRPQETFGAYIPRGFVHEIEPGPSGIEYLVAAFTDGDMSIHSINATSNKYQYAIYPVTNQRGQELALEPMSSIKRWQHEDKPSDQEQYIQGALKTSSNVKIIIFYSYGKIVGSALVGRSEGYDLQKTQAMVEYGKGDPQEVSEQDVWINYQSWECRPGESPFAFSEDELPGIWNIFAVATKEAFPEAKSVAVRSRHREIWSYVYSPPWKLVKEIDLRGFEWTAPDNRKFSGYDARFANYGILRLPLV